MKCQEKEEYKLFMSDSGIRAWQGNPPPENIGYIFEHVAAQAIIYLNSGATNVFNLLRVTNLGEAHLYPDNRTIDVLINQVRYQCFLVKNQAQAPHNKVFQGTASGSP